MSITRAQQFKQLVNPPMKGKKRPGYRGEAAAASAAASDRGMQGRSVGSDPQGRGDGPATNDRGVYATRDPMAQFTGNVDTKNLKFMDEARRRANPLGVLTQIPGGIGMIARFLTPNPFGFAPKPSVTSVGGGGGDSQAMVDIPTWMRLGFSSEAEYLASLEKEDEKEDEGLRLAFRADGGRIGLQEGGGIEQRLEKLGGDVSSAEKMLQGINKRLETAESSLGSGGGIGSLPAGIANNMMLPQPSLGVFANGKLPTPIEFDNNRPSFMGRPLFQPFAGQPLKQPLASPIALEEFKPSISPINATLPGTLIEAQPAMLEASRPLEALVDPEAVAQPLPIQTPPESLPVAQPTIFGYNTGGGLYDAKKDFTSLEDAFEFAQKNAEVLRRGTDFTSAQAPSIDPNTGKFIPFAGELSFDDFSKNFSLQDGALIQNPNTVTGTAGRPIFSTTTDPTFFGIGAEGLTPQQFTFGGSQDPQQAYLDNIAAINANRGGIPAAGYADGGNVVGGEFDFESARQMYGFGKLVKKIGRAVKKVAKSPIGKAALLYAGGTYLGGLKTFGGAGFGSGNFLTNLKSGQGIGNLARFASGKLFGNVAYDDVIGTKTGGLLSKIPGGGVTAAIAGTSLLAGLLTPKQEEEAEMLAAEKGIDIEKARRSILARAQGNFADDFRATAFRAEGGPAESKEPVAKKTMPLLDMGGQEMDLRAEGGFVPIGRMEKADDVPARLSKNEFVFTADAVRNAGDGDVDKGAEVMYNMMKNLEAGGEVSEESQGLKGARKMFQTSQRLEEVL